MRAPLLRVAVIAALAALAVSLLFPGGKEKAPPEFPHAPRVASGGGGLAIGLQVQPGLNGEYQLVEQAAIPGAVAFRGRFRGQLAGLAADDDGVFHALTRDGALVSVADESTTVALPDSRWDMRALAWRNGSPVAVDYSAGALRLVVPDGRESWRPEGEPIACDENPGEIEVVALGDELHVLWCGPTRDLARGAFRHVVVNARGSTEIKPLPLGNVASFTAFRSNESIFLVAAVSNILRPDDDYAIEGRLWRQGGWVVAPPLPEGIVDKLERSLEFAAAPTPSGTRWLVSDPRGAFLYAQSESRLTREADIMVTDERQGIDPLWTSLGGLALPVVFIALALLHCRRSRLLSRNLPGYPADLVTRAAALAIDWIIVSVGIAAYHIAAGNMHVQREVFSLHTVDEIFWASLAGLAIFTAVAEAAYGRTPGKYLAGIRVRNVRGGSPTVLQAVIRNAARAIDMTPVVFPGLIGAVVSILNPRRQRLGDILGSTMVRRHAPLRYRKVVLASQSPRRKDLLEALGLDLRVQPADIDENSVPMDDPAGAARLLAEAKTRAVAPTITNPRELVIAADTMVVADDKILGKPADEADARRMLALLSGRSHSVFTGVSIWDPATGQGLSDVEETEVEFRQLSQSEIDRYVASGDPMDKAGAYGVQSGFLVKQIRGSLSNVAGLPMEMLEGMLASLDS